MNKKIKIIIYLALIIAITTTIFVPKLINNKTSESNNSPINTNIRKPLSIIVERLSPDSLSEKLISVGNIIADEMVNLSFESSGKIIEILFSEGERVEKGQLLARINDATLQAKLLSLKADLPILENKKYRSAQLLNAEAISQEDYDIAKSNLTKLQAEIAITQAEIDKCLLVAPFTGVIGLRQISLGEFVSTSTSIASLTKMNPLILEFSYPEQYANRVKNDDIVNFNLTDGIKKYSAKVYAIEPMVDNATKTITARAIFHNDDERVVPGRFVSVDVNLDDKTSAISVPSEALILELGRAIVFKYSAGKAHQITVTTGIRNESRVEITSGLSEGDTIAVSGIMQLRDGMSVSFVN